MFAKDETLANDQSYSVPPERMMILDESGMERASVVGPYIQGANLVLRCDVYGGDPRPWVRWYRDDQPVGGPARQLLPGGPVRSELVLKNLGRADLHSQLRCAANNNNRTAPVEAVVTVDMNFGPLNVRILGASQPLSAGRRYDLLCQSSGSRPPASITWWRNGQRLERTKETTSNDGNTTTSTLSFNASKEDAGKYLNCRAENPVLSSDGLEDGWKLEIQYVPEARLQLGTSLNPDAIREGTDVYFDCLINAQPGVYKVEWRHNGRLLNHNVGQGVIVSNQSLVLQGVSRASAGNYTCVGFNAEGDGESAPFYLNVMYAPTCKPNQSRVHGVAKQEKARIACEVEANPPVVDFRWTFNNSAETVEVQENHITKNGTVSLVSYTPQTEMDYGTLLCWASNRIGHQRVPCVFHIIAAGRPDQVHNCTVANASMTSFSVRCNEGFNGGLPQSFQLEVRESHSQTLHANVTAAVPHFSVAGLEPGANYQACVYSFNLKGRSEPVPVQAATLRRPEKQHTLDKERGSPGLRFTPMLNALIGVVAALLIVAVVAVAVLRVQCSRNADRRKRHKAAAAAAAAASDGRAGGGGGAGGGGSGAPGGGVDAQGAHAGAGGCGPYGADPGPAAAAVVAVATAADKIGSPLRKMDAALGADGGVDPDEKNPDIIPQASTVETEECGEFGRQRQHISTIESAAAARAGGLLQQGLGAGPAFAPGYCTLRNGLPLHDLNNLAAKPKMKALNDSAGYPTLPRQHWAGYSSRHGHAPHAHGHAMGGGGALLCASYPGHLQHPAAPQHGVPHHLLHAPGLVHGPHAAHAAHAAHGPHAHHGGALGPLARAAAADLSPPLPPLVRPAATAAAAAAAAAAPPPAAADDDPAANDSPLMVTKRESTV